MDVGSGSSMVYIDRSGPRQWTAIACFLNPEILGISHDNTGNLKFLDWKNGPRNFKLEWIRDCNPYLCITACAVAQSCCISDVC